MLAPMETTALLTEARRLLAAGQTLMALRVFEDVHARDPDEPEALNALAVGALRAGQPARAIELLAPRLERKPDDAVSRHHLAQAQRAAGDRHGALANWSLVLRAHPDQFVARLALAQTLEEDGDVDAALVHYFRAISDAQRQGRWLSRNSTPQPLLAAVQHAMRTVNEGRRRLFDTLLEPLRTQFGRVAMQRVDRCLAIVLGEMRPQPADPRQQPTFLFFPGLPASPFLDRKLEPQLDALAEQSPAILDELRAVMESSRGREAVFHTGELARANLAGTHGEAPEWNGYYFHREGEPREGNRQACPRTAAALDALPLSRVRGHGPETLFSVLSPGTHLLPHRGVTNTRIVGHLPLIVPPDCALRVADIEHRWQVGEPVIFDDTYLHEAWNRSGETRVVLIFDLWNPHLDLAERLAVAQLVAAIGDFRTASDRMPA
jgi:aspartate beta-hydroxylase